ncbi:hypothetical protein BUY49_07025 [Staphylococcus devriesei]|uniref:holin n=1 Tax=Staphylococcus devriesei TaxID=586733 RepID=UPI000E68BAFF|nr:holin [Staphylococcus devriesei]RIL71325.1 hypothetical protein BUY49_07025 [Staphylococcus devriesei]
MENIIAFATVISVITIALTQLVKQAGVPKNIVPLIAIGIGILLGGISAFIPELVTELSIGGRLLAGLISGLMATGMWETVRTRTGYTNETDKKIGGGKA